MLCCITKIMLKVAKYEIQPLWLLHCTSSVLVVFVGNMMALWLMCWTHMSQLFTMNGQTLLITAE